MIDLHLPGIQCIMNLSYELVYFALRGEAILTASIKAIKSSI